MDNKIKLFAISSVVALMASGCTGYNQGASGSNGYASNGSSQYSGSGQVARNTNTCTPCTARRNTYTYKPRPRTVYKPKPKPRPRTVYKPKPKPRVAGQHNQQYYIDRWNRQQNQNRAKAKPKPRTNYSNYSNYSGYGSSYYVPNTASSTTYYDYSSAGKSKATTNRNLSTSNKSIYTGSYQKRTYKPYKPTTYAGGGTTYKAVTSYSGGSSSSHSGGNTYIVKKGDTVFEIMRQTGVYWKDIIRINNLKAPYNIHPGQVIRLK